MSQSKLHIRETDRREIKSLCGIAFDLITPKAAGSKKISFATIYIDPEKSSTPHYHKLTEEVYYFLEGNGRVKVGDQVFEVSHGSAVYIPVLQTHQVFNDGSTRLKFTSADSPPFDRKDVYQP